MFKTLPNIKVQLIPIIFASLATIFFALPPDCKKLYPEKFQSYEICDCQGRVLRKVLSDDYKTSIWAELDDISPWMIETTLQREDKRFFKHMGVDPFALLRSIYENIKHGRIISGGSTITMQVAKMTLGHKGRNLFNKVLEMFYAAKLELHLSKADILEIYLNRVPYGNQNYGVEAAARYYFQKPAAKLSLGECSILAVIPRSPALLNPYRSPQRILKAKSNILQRLLNRKIIDSLSFANALKESLGLVSYRYDFHAAHFVDYVNCHLEEWGIEDPSRIITALNLELQRDLEDLLKTTLRSLKGYQINQGAILVIDRRNGMILAMVGSRDYFDAGAGQVNGCLALRQPGSTIKPFVYLMALEAGIPPSYILPDTLVEFKLADGTRFAPRNYSNRYHGSTRAREALAASFNIPTVYLLDMLGSQRFYHFLREAGFKSLDRKSHFYGLSLGLGAGEVTLLELANGYRTIANGGIYQKEKMILTAYDRFGNEIMVERRGFPQKIFSREAAFIITDILSDNASRIKAFGVDSPLNIPFPCASKTGTSKGYRDNWCVGFSDDFVVGVWVGNFDGSSMEGVSGISGAAPLYRDIMIELHRNYSPEIFEEPEAIVHVKICTHSGKIARPECSSVIEEVFIPTTEPRESCDLHHGHRSRPAMVKDRMEIVHPVNGDIFRIDPQVSKSAQRIKFSVAGPDEIEEVVFILDGHTVGKKSQPFEIFWEPEKGEHRLEIIGRGEGFKDKEHVRFKVL